MAELELAKQSIPVFEKKRFSMCIPPVTEVLGSSKSVILCGIEAHVCVLHTVFDMLDKGIAVHVVADAVSSRSQTDRYLLKTQKHEPHIACLRQYSFEQPSNCCKVLSVEYVQCVLHANQMSSPAKATFSWTVVCSVFACWLTKIIFG